MGAIEIVHVNGHGELQLLLSGTWERQPVHLMAFSGWDVLSALSGDVARDIEKDVGRGMRKSSCLCVLALDL